LNEEFKSFTELSGESVPLINNMMSVLMVYVLKEKGDITYVLPKTLFSMYTIISLVDGP
jgi:hypothetical protein